MTMLAILASMATIGADEAPPFRVGIELPSQVPFAEPVEKALQDIGIDFVNFYVSNAPEWEPPEAETTAAMIAVCERLGVDFALSCHHRDPAEASVQAAAASEARFEGVLFDELPHIRMFHPEFAHVEDEYLFADTSELTTLAEAHEAASAGYKRLKAQMEAYGAPGVIATHVWPELMHTAARAGFTPCPKIAKETYSPVSLTIGLGAALQYGRDLWVDCDMWYFHLVPGHPPAEIWSNLLFAYWMGGDLVYLEGSGYNLLPAGRQGVPFSLMKAPRPDRYQLTPHGAMLKRFIREYLPANPRPWSFRDIRPEAAIIRFEDGDFGQDSWGVNKLFGSDNLQRDADTQAWLTLWNVLTHGRTGGDGLMYFKIGGKAPETEPRHHVDIIPSYATQPDAAAYHDFFTPLNGVVVFDERVGYDLLSDIPLLFLTGKRLSEETAAAVRRRVEEGAVCVAWGPLAAKRGLATDWTEGVVVEEVGAGRFVFTDDFAAEEAVAEYEAWLGPEDEIRYRFGERTLVLKRGGSQNDITVEVTPPLE